MAVRCGDAVLRLDTVTGALIWRVEVGKRTGDGTFLSPLGDGLVTNVIRPPERLAQLVGITSAGKRAWTTDVDAIVAADAATIVDGVLFVVGVAPAEQAPRSCGASSRAAA